MTTLLGIIKVIAIVIVVFFVVTFTVYIFNLDMKMMAMIKPLFEKHYDKRKRDRKI